MSLRQRKYGELTERAQPKLNKYDPGSLLGYCVYILEKAGLRETADEVRKVSKRVASDWVKRER